MSKFDTGTYNPVSTFAVSNRPNKPIHSSFTDLEKQSATMKLRLTYTLFLALLAAAVFMGNKNGRASTPPGAGNTGAPGDEALPNGTAIVCSSCHTPGGNNPVSSNTVISVLDSAGNAVTQYQPGKLYTARVTVNTLTGNPLRWGFQMIALRDAGNTDLDGFSDINPNNYKLATVNATGRTYAEHSNSSTTNIFNVRWTAPAAGTGNITFYAAGNAVNNDGLNTGDGSSVASLKLTESSTTSAQNPDAVRIGLKIWPNPVASVAGISAVLPQAGAYRLSAIDLSGNTVWESHHTLTAGENRLDLTTDGWAPGIYLIRLSGAGISANVKVAKF